MLVSIYAQSCIPLVSELNIEFPRAVHIWYMGINFTPQSDWFIPIFQKTKQAEKMLRLFAFNIHCAFLFHPVHFGQTSK
jgi:hypothetical protein